MILDNILNYRGSHSLSFIGERFGLPIDQVNFIASQLFALFLSCFFKKYVTSPRGRLWFCMLAGVGLTVFCFGNQVGHILCIGVVAYLIMNTQYESEKMPWYVLAFSMLYLSALHWRRQFLESGYNSLDITGPMMVLTQKLTALAFSVRDGKERKKSDSKQQSDLQERYLVENVPSVFEFSSYVFQFQSMLAGPLVMYSDFITFIHRQNVPSSGKVVLQKLFQCGICALAFVKLDPMFPVTVLSSEDFLDHSSWLTQVLLVVVVTTTARFKYYHAWALADAVCNASGLGYDETTESWDSTTNVRPVSFELALNFKETLDHWNIGTGKWLRHVMYERVPPSSRTVLTYLLSAFWHGYYPGYYLTFLTGALFTSSARVVRRFCRPLALKSTAGKVAYDCLTWLSARLAIAYATFTFMILDFWPSIAVYKELYFFMHVLGFAAMFGIPPLFKATGFAPSSSRTPRPVVSEAAVSTPELGKDTTSPPPDESRSNHNTKNNNETISELISSQRNTTGVSAKLKTG